MGLYITKLAESPRFPFPLRPYSRAPGCLKHELLNTKAGPGVKEGTADSQLPRKINLRNTTVQLREPQEDTKEQAKEPRINFSADPDF